MLLEWGKLYKYHEIGFDRAKAVDVVIRMTDGGLNLVDSPQRPTEMTTPITRFEDLVIAHKLRHDGNPLLKWCVQNARVIEVPSANTPLKKIRKANYRARIDCATAALTALSRLLVAPKGWEGATKGSIYESRGVRFFG